MSQSPGNNSDSDDSLNRSKDWEMVSLASSSTNAENGANDVSSEHFIFPPNRHEGLPINKEDENDERSEKDEDDSIPLLDSEYSVPGETVDEIEGKQEGEAALTGLGIESSKVNKDGAEEEEEEEEEEEMSVSESRYGIDETAQLNRRILSEKSGGENGPSEGWWKRQATYLGQSNKLWSVAVAAALMGLVFLGQRWQHERWQNQQMRLQLCAKDEKISELLYQVARLKEAASGRRKVSVVRTGSA